MRVSHAVGNNAPAGHELTTRQPDQTQTMEADRTVDYTGLRRKKPSPHVPPSTSTDDTSEWFPQAIPRTRIDATVTNVRNPARYCHNRHRTNIPLTQFARSRTPDSSCARTRKSMKTFWRSQKLYERSCG
ncbi:hypothetical protein NSPZN2_100301 [Nitrospira defluvii]|uniref:Uncharacterized protein n=1 Tax=Nitrospira defluvii TaxID=330214 RepID=A0ABM8R2S0_9BACT|nr:hypothetical protein NSPZN2_100301 [Nitrospira defluvii]